MLEKISEVGGGGGEGGGGIVICQSLQINLVRDSSLVAYTITLFLWPTSTKQRGKGFFLKETMDATEEVTTCAWPAILAWSLTCNHSLILCCACLCSQ